MTLTVRLYQLRLRQLARQYGMRLEERVSERTRIARELHDTLLQSFHGLLLRFQAAYELLPARPAEAKQSLERTIPRLTDAEILPDARRCTGTIPAQADLCVLNLFAPAWN
jgi:signal transduction histidine kinase